MKQKKSETAHIHIFVQMIFDFHYSKVVLQEYSCRGVESQPAVNARVVGAVDMSLCGGHSKQGQPRQIQMPLLQYPTGKWNIDDVRVDTSAGLLCLPETVAHLRVAT